MLTAPLCHECQLFYFFYFSVQHFNLLQFFGFIADWYTVIIQCSVSFSIAIANGPTPLSWCWIGVTGNRCSDILHFTVLLFRIWKIHWWFTVTKIRRVSALIIGLVPLVRCTVVPSDRVISVWQMRLTYLLSITFNGAVFATSISIQFFVFWCKRTGLCVYFIFVSICLVERSLWK